MTVLIGFGVLIVFGYVVVSIAYCYSHAYNKIDFKKQNLFGKILVVSGYIFLGALCLSMLLFCANLIGKGVLELLAK
jgi:hypothetical protein